MYQCAEISNNVCVTWVQVSSIIDTLTLDDAKALAMAIIPVLVIAFSFRLVIRFLRSL